MKKKTNKSKISNRSLLGFLKKTKAGKYGKVRNGDLPQARVEILRQEETLEEECFYYSTW